MKKTTLLASAVMLAILTGCGSKDAAEHYTDAQNYIAEKKYNAAVIELKSAIQQSPQQADYRQALGKLYLQLGDPVSAAKELSRALELGADASVVAIPLIQAHYLAEDYQAVLAGVDETKTLSPQTENYIKLYQALAEIELSSIDSAVPLFDELLLVEQADLNLFAEAALSISAKSYDNAQLKLQQIATDSPVYFQAVLMQAHVAFILKQHDAALEGLHRYLDYMPSALKVRLLAAQILVQKSEFAEAERHLNQLRKAAPEHGLTNYLTAVVEYQKQNYQAAKEHIDKALQAKHNTLQSRVLAGLTNYQLGLETQALVHLSAVKQYLPQLPDINRLYTALQLKAGETLDAAQSISATELTTQDLALISTTALELIKKGDDAAAAELIARYEQFVVSEDADSLQTLGRLKLSISGQEAAGIQALEQSLLLDPSQHHTRLILAGSYIRLKQYDKAEALADEWINNTDTAAAGYNLKALLALLQQDLSGGKALLDKAFSADKDNVFTYFLLSVIAQQENDTALADQHLLTAISLRSDYQPALANYYQSQSRQGKPEVAIALVEKSQKAHPDNIQLRLLLANLYQLNKRPADIVSLIAPVVDQQQQLPPAFYLLLSRAYATLNQIEPGLKVTQRWLNDTPNSLPATFAHVNFLASAKRYDEALRIVNNTLQRHPQNAILLKTKMHMQAENKDYKGALATYAQLPADIIENADMLYHKGRIQLLDNQLTPGLQSLHKSYNQHPSPVTALAIAEATAKDISYRRAVTFVEEHFAKHGDNKALRAFYANLLLQDDVNKAVNIYQKLVEEEPDNLISLNNYAWVLQQAGKTEEALPYIERAMKINANHPDILDSYGKILFALGRYDKAKAQYEKSLQLRPANAEVQLNYAELLIKTAVYQQAEEILNAVNSDDPNLMARKTTLLAALP